MKQKTRKALKKRISFTANGKMMRKPAAVSHLRVNKSPRTTASKPVHAADIKRIKQMLPND